MKKKKKKWRKSGVLFVMLNIREAKTAPEIYLGQDGFHIPPAQEKEYLRGGSRPKGPNSKLQNFGLGSHDSNPFNFNPKIFCSIFYVPSVI